MEVTINDRISYLPGREEPLSSEVVIIKGEKYIWIYDVGAGEEALSYINERYGEKCVVLSHFHNDHTENLGGITYHKLYQGAYTKKHTGEGNVVEEEITITDGVKITLFPIPCSHAKGCIGLIVDDTYAFVGDAIYPAKKHDELLYNVSLLAQEITLLKETKAEYFGVSHKPNFVYKKKAILAFLESVYRRRKTGEAYSRGVE